MNNNKTKTTIRWFFLFIGVIAMLFAGILYAWSILKSPLAAAYQWSPSQLAMNFTIAMSFFCIGGLLGAQISKRMGHQFALFIAGGLSALGFVTTALLAGISIWMLYITYGVLAGLGIGIAYNVVISTVSSWFPDKKGFCSGCLMMGFGASALLLGNAADAMFKSFLGWRLTYILLGAAICGVLVTAGFLLRKADNQMEQKNEDDTESNNPEHSSYKTMQMLRQKSFWMAFFCISFLAAVGSSVISFAKDLALSVHAPESLAVTLVGVLSICNGLGRILTGAIFDLIGCRKTMISANVLTIGAAAVTLLAVTIGSLPLCILGLCLTGISYGACPTITSAFTSSHYGMKYFSTNMAIMTFTVMGGSLIATVSNRVQEATGGYAATFLMLLVLSFFALALNYFIPKSKL